MYISYAGIIQKKTSKKTRKKWEKTSKKWGKNKEKTVWKWLGMDHDCSGTVAARLQRPCAMPGQWPGHPELLSELLLALRSEQQQSRAPRWTGPIIARIMDFHTFPQNRDFLRKFKVTESIPILSYAIQGMHTRRETTPWHPGRVCMSCVSWYRIWIGLQL